ncbi:MAG: hypothetical protein LBJ12_03270 [Oscillospiraceae bacterium]|jgi:Na+-translocating ferredoxin:NAD+ oxidoreductase RnfA subunit|nr:hypothetical protein [Oscillospiraceae bacterium]
MSAITEMIFIALYTVFIQNLVFTGGFGMGEALRIATKPRRFLIFAGLLTGFSALDTLVCAALYTIPALDALPTAYQLPINACVLLVLFLLVVLTVTIITKRRPMDKFLSTIGMAALNTLVFILPFLGRRSAFGLGGALAFGFGAGVAFLLALAVLRLGVNRIMESKAEIPHAFRGTPALFIYSALFSLAMVGLVGETLFA